MKSNGQVQQGRKQGLFKNLNYTQSVDAAFHWLFKRYWVHNLLSFIIDHLQRFWVFFKSWITCTLKKILFVFSIQSNQNRDSLKSRVSLLELFSQILIDSFFASSNNPNQMGKNSRVWLNWTKTSRYPEYEYRKQKNTFLPCNIM